jgi:hypothetical protein
VGVAVTGPPGGSAPLPPGGDVQFGGDQGNSDNYDPAKDPELNADLGDEDGSDFDFSGDGEAAPDVAKAPAAEPAVAGGGDETETELRAFVEGMDALLRQGGEALSRPETAPAEAPQDFAPVQLTREQLEAALDDPDKLNEVLAEVQRQAVAQAREVFHAEAQKHAVQAQTEVAKREADAMFREHSQLDTPEIRAKCALVAQTLVSTMPELQQDIPTLMKYTAKYMTARMQTHPHEFVAGRPAGLPPLPGAKAQAVEAPVQPGGAPAKPGAPVFAGVGTSARRINTEAPKMSAEERELFELKPEHAW